MVSSAVETPAEGPSDQDEADSIEDNIALISHYRPGPREISDDERGRDAQKRGTKADCLRRFTP
jgi:hypothetical protein